MAFAQINYSQKLGNGPYTIAEAGCFVTAFSNLLGRFGEQIDPPTLNNYFLQHNKYVHDPAEPAGTVDDVSWGTVSSYDGQVVCVGIGGAGWPDSNDAIVEFRYRGPRTGQEVTHFTLVADASKHTIVDSYDGVTKVSPYGTPVAWAKYERHAPVVVAPPPPAAAPAYAIENIPERTEQLKVSTHLWDLNQRTWPGLVNNPVGNGSAGTEFKTNQIAHHILGGQYYLPEGSTTQGYNVVDCQDPPAAPAPPPPAPVAATPPPAPAAPQSYTENTIDGIRFEAIPGNPVQYWVTNPKGADKWSFKNVQNWRGFKSVDHLAYGTEVFITGIAHHPVPPNGADYYMPSADFGDFKKTGKPTNYYGFNWTDISTKRPPAEVPAPPAPPAPTVTETAPAKPAAAVPPATHTVDNTPVSSTTSTPWGAPYRPFAKPLKLFAVRDVIVKDLAGKEPDMPLPRYDPTLNTQVGIVMAYGVVSYDGQDFYRLKTNNDPNFDFWYCVPKIDPATKTPLLLVMPNTSGATVNKISVARDTLELAKARLENDVPKFLDDIMPKWFKNKK